MANIGRVFNQIKSNEAIRNVPVVKNLFTQGDGLGASAAFKDAKHSRQKMKQANRLDSSIASKITKNEKEIASQQAKFDKGAMDEARFNRSREALQNRNAVLEGRRKGLSASADSYQDDLIDQSIAGVKNGLGYMTGRDLRGGGGSRAMAVGVRGAAIGGAYMGANTGLRYISGGGMTYNNQGERDIAGIPFL